MNEYVDFQNALALAIASGIGGDGEMMVQETLWEGNPVQYPITITCSKNPYDYDLLVINTGGWQDIVIVKDVIGRTVGLHHRLDNTNYQTIRFNLSNSSKNIEFIKYSSSGSGVDPYWLLNKVIGIKFTGTKSIDYSEEEQVIGKWIDGKPLYQRSVKATIVEGNTYLLNGIDALVNSHFIIKSKTDNLYYQGYTAFLPMITADLTKISLLSYNGDVIFQCNNYTSANRILYSGNYEIIATIQYTKTTD